MDASADSASGTPDLQPLSDFLAANTKVPFPPGVYQPTAPAPALAAAAAGTLGPHGQAICSAEPGNGPGAVVGPIVPKWWTDAETQQMMELRETGMLWKDIATFMGRTEGSLRKKYHRCKPRGA
ncbi:hypothetical protein BD289DRAFT_471425 [Coniella lustricola]|uniref:Myb-like domain-containing protein n=1 Tax=Coniella lustricola TaxID=2025994 RepID=A0A2T3AJX6_9PEZI|nr:hypothetical protein BD289DRAFT_471425 [Coniella lustricola]